MSQAHASEPSKSPEAPLLAFWALVTGAIAGIVGSAFRLSVDRVAHLTAVAIDAAPRISLPEGIAAAATSATLVALAVLLVRRVAPETAGSGVQEIEGALGGERPVRWRRILPIKFAGGALALGAGLELGREGPCIHLGGAAGRMLGDLTRLSREGVHVLIAAGAGAGLTAAFGAPLAGMLLVFEEMRPQFHYNAVSILCVIVACSVAELAVVAMIGTRPVVPMTVLPLPALESIWLFLVLGALVGCLGLAFNRGLVACIGGFDAIPQRLRVAAAATAAAGVGVLGWLWPSLLGGGYGAVHDALSDSLVRDGLLAVFVARFGITIVSYGIGAPGGIFAPMIALGTLAGVLYGDLSAHWMPSLVDTPDAFVIAGMGALFAASVRAPLTGIALVVEITGNPGQVVPVGLACGAATLVAYRLGGRPIYTVLLERTLARARDH